LAVRRRGREGRGSKGGEGGERGGRKRRDLWLFCFWDRGGEEEVRLV